MIRWLIGVLVGVPGTLPQANYMSSILFGLKAIDPVSMVAVILLLGTIALIAGVIPARWATKSIPWWPCGMNKRIE